MVIKNELFNPKSNYCLFVNTDKPRVDYPVVAYSCVQSIVMGNNSEIFTYNNDGSIIHYPSGFCVGFAESGSIVLKSCDKYNPAFTLQMSKSSTLFFNGYADKCIVMIDSTKISENLVTPSTEVIVTTQADETSFKKSNFLYTGENTWSSVPGQKQATVQIMFGKLPDGTYETRKIDLIKISWSKTPKKIHGLLMGARIQLEIGASLRR